MDSLIIHNDPAKNMEDGMLNIIKNHVLNNPITCESSKAKSTSDQKEERIKRPMNAFMVFSHQARKMIAKENPNLKNSDLSKYLGITWKGFSEEKKEMFKKKAEELRAKHKKDHPLYKYQPRRKKSKVCATPTVNEKPVRASKPYAKKKSVKINKEFHSDMSVSSNNSNNDLYIDETPSPNHDPSYILYEHSNNNYPLPDAVNTLDYLFNNNNVNNPGHRHTPSVLTPPSTPINSGGCSSPSLTVLSSHLHPNMHTNNRGHDFSSPTKASAMDSSYLYNAQQSIMAIEPEYAYNCLPNIDCNNDFMPMDQCYSTNYGYEQHKFNLDTSEDEKKYIVNGPEQTRIGDGQSGYMQMQYNGYPFLTRSGSSY